MTSSPDERKPTLVVGGTGKTGRRVAERLAARGVPVRIGSRSASRRSTGRTARPGRPPSRGWNPPTLVLPGRRGPGRGGDGRLVRRARRCEWCPAACAAVRARRARGRARRAGSARLRRRADDRSRDLVRPELQRGGLRRSRAGRRGPLPAEDMPEPFVDVDDIADVAVAALTEEGTRASSTAHRPTVADVRGSSRRDRPGGQQGDPLRAGLDGRVRVAARRAGACRPISCGS